VARFGGEILQSPMANMKPPTVPEKPPTILRREELKALLATCDGTDFDERRDSAILRLFLDSGIRRAEIAGLRVDDVDFDHEIVVVLGKSRRPARCAGRAQDLTGASVTPGRTRCSLMACRKMT
jgi:site-specific recombinase XerC